MANAMKIDRFENVNCSMCNEHQQVELLSAARLLFLSDAPQVVLKRNAALFLIKKQPQFQGHLTCLLGDAANSLGVPATNLAAAVDGDSCFKLHGYLHLGSKAVLYLDHDELLDRAKVAWQHSISATGW